MARIARKEILTHLYDCIDKRIPIIGSGAGIGLSAKSEEMGGTDLIICYNTGIYRMHGRSSTMGILSVGDSNGQLLEMAPWILGAVKKTPVLGGVFANDPLRDMNKFLDQLCELGFSGIQNFPTVGGFDGHWRQICNTSDITYEKEVEMIKLANQKDMLTTPYVWCEDDAMAMAAAGADIVVLHAGMTAGGSNGADPSVLMSMDDTCKYVQRLRDAAVSVRKDVICIVHGGLVAFPKDFEYVMNHTTGIHGFYGASSVERLPVEVAISNCIREFKSVKF